MRFTPGLAGSCSRLARVAALVLAAAGRLIAADYPIQPVPFTAVRLTGGFWEEHQAVNRTVTVPFAMKQCEDSGRLGNFDDAADTMRQRRNGHPTFQHTPRTQYPFDDTDAYKAIEGASYVLSLSPDPALEAKLDTWIARIAAAQEPDGYLYTFRTMHPDSPAHKWIDQERWVNDPKSSHELYCAGHLYEAGVAYYQATGKRSLLEVCLRNAELLWRDFGDGKRRLAPGHEIVELGLVRLYRVTQDPRWLSLAKTFLDNRGPGGPAYSQQDLKVVDQIDAHGHAVRANYLYCGMADVAAMTGDRRYFDAINRIWSNVVTTKLYVMGGVGAREKGESYGADYELPNAAYNETCAAVAFMMWNHRMFLMTGDAKYMDVFERTAYNGFISGVSESGDRFFYTNPLVYDGQAKNNAGFAGRAPWFGCACCPPNLMRMLASFSGYFYAAEGDRLFVNLYGQNDARLNVAGTAVHLTQATEYPWKGEVVVTVTPAQPTPFTLKLRVPGWTRGVPVPSDLYRYRPGARSAWGVTVAGQEYGEVGADGYVTLTRTWRAGDVVRISFPMPVETVHGNSKVAALQGLSALERGPLVYCVEESEPNPALAGLRLTLGSSVKTRFRSDLLGGVVALEVAPDKGNGPGFEAIPYFAWDNRGLDAMQVWFPEIPDLVAFADRR